MKTGLLAPNEGDGGAMAGDMPDETGAPAEGAAEDQPNVTPEEQAQYDAFVETGLTIIADDRLEAPLLKSLGGSKDPILSLASTAVNVVARIEAAASKAGQKIPGEIILHGGQQIVEALAEMAGAAKIHEYTAEEVEGAFYRAADMYREEKQARGEIDEAGAKEDLAALKQADQAGQLPPQFQKAAAAMSRGQGGQ